MTMMTMETAFLVSANGSDSVVEAVPLTEAYAADSTFLRWLSVAAALYLLSLRKTDWWSINIQIIPFVVYLELNLPSILFDIIRENFGRWITFIIVTLHLFLRKYLLDFCGFPVALLLLTVTLPYILASCLRNNILGAIISVGIGSYLLDRHIRYRGTVQAFAEKHFWINILAIILLLSCPLLEVYHFLE